MYPQWIHSRVFTLANQTSGTEVPSAVFLHAKEVAEFFYFLGGIYTWSKITCAGVSLSSADQLAPSFLPVSVGVAS
jgi:hypothetical protein